MNEQGSEWMASLQRHIQKCRRENPIPDRESLSPLDESRCQILGGSFVSWFQRELPEIEKNRYFFERSLKWELNPFLVFTSEMPGLVALNLIIPPAENTMTAFCLEDEFQSWYREHPDDRYQWHVHHWGYFRSPEEDILERAVAEHPISREETYWQHHVGTLWGPSMGNFIDHLWAWNQQEMRLLEEAFSGGVY